MPAKELSPEQRAEAAALNARFREHQAREREAGRDWTQDALAAKLDLGQSALNQYLGGKIPLNADVVLKLSEMLASTPADISPIVAREQEAFRERWERAAGRRPALSELAAQAAADFDAVPEEKRSMLAALWENVRILVLRGQPVSITVGLPAEAAARGASAPRSTRRAAT